MLNSIGDLWAAAAGFLVARGLAAFLLKQMSGREPPACSRTGDLSAWGLVGLFLGLEAVGWAWIGESVFLIAAGLLRKGITHL